ncbi:MAG TPA: hypothetical protein PK306_02910 [Aquabacterium sp.]|nr:hypothetical protein [Aquabacterium sp.]HQC94642.1 hypothetical protein [Aquabacterium sp.]
MSSTSASHAAHALIDRAGQRGDAILHDGVDTAHQAVGGLSESARQLQADAARLRQRSLDAMREGSELVRERARRAGERSVGYIRDEPVKSVLVAAAAGAALMALFSLVGGRAGR